MSSPTDTKIAANQQKLEALQEQMKAIKASMMSAEQLEAALNLEHDRFDKIKTAFSKLITAATTQQSLIVEIEKEITFISTHPTTNEARLPALLEKKNASVELLLNFDEERKELDNQLQRLDILINEFDQRITESKLGTHDEQSFEEKFSEYQRIEQEIREVLRENQALLIASPAAPRRNSLFAHAKTAEKLSPEIPPEPETPQPK